MTAERQTGFISAMRPNFHEWDAVLSDPVLTSSWAKIAARTLVVSARATKRPISEIVDVLKLGRPDWHFEELSEGGHMAPLTCPDLVNPLVRRFLDQCSAQAPV
jgi:pimeloyl-ACP methyl ester carboxylesterase